LFLTSKHPFCHGSTRDAIVTNDDFFTAQRQMRLRGSGAQLGFALVPQLPTGIGIRALWASTITRKWRLPRRMLQT
jgi:hypothetical protein